VTVITFIYQEKKLSSEWQSNAELLAFLIRSKSLQINVPGELKISVLNCQKLNVKYKYRITTSIFLLQQMTL
jgi:hypothetical protein